MSDASFNPYHQWLGLERSVTRPNHYQLLGLAPTETNAQRIAEAANRALAKVRSCQPGPRGAEWAKLVEQVTMAASCLCDPARRAEYDRQLGSDAAAGRSVNRPAPRSRVVPAAGGASAALPMQAPQGAGPQGPAGAGGYVDPMAPIASAGSGRATPMYGHSAGNGAPQTRPSSAAPAYPAAMGNPAVGTPMPVAPRSGGSGYPSAGRGREAAGMPMQAVPAGRPAGRVVAPVPVATASIAGKNRSTTSKVRSRAKSSSLVFLAVGAGVCMILLAGAIFVIVLSRQADDRNRQGYRPAVRHAPTVAEPSPGPESFRRPTPAHRPARPVRRKSKPLPRAKSHDHWPVSGTPEAVLPEVPAAPGDPSPAPAESATDPGFSPPAVNLPSSVQPAEMPAASPTPDAAMMLPAFPAAPTLDPLNQSLAQPASPEFKPSLSDGKLEPPKPAEPAAAARDVKPDQIAALAQTLKAAHAAILDRKYDVALAELAKIATLPKLPEHHAKYERLTLLAGYAKNFQSSLQSAIAGLEAGDEIEVGSSTVVGFVGAAQDSITLRVTGTNRTYALDSLPPGLAVALADRWLKKDDPVSLAVKGAYLASLKDIDDERKAKARQWLEEASRKGIEGDLQKILDDSYDFGNEPAKT